VVAEARIIGQRPQPRQRGDRRGGGLVEVEQPETESFVPAGVDLEHCLPGPRQVVGSADGLGQVGEQHRLPVDELCQLHRAGGIAADQHPLGPRGVVVDVGQHRDRGPQQPAEQLQRRGLGHRCQF
jgi:hypothetical protein